ncbi:hypothetical protein BC828DRAFT_409310 [Blastocladiella britannica]|nr:hypothetical protein BC828DRAFT_409310 [Blastocladiella britannica]
MFWTRFYYPQGVAAPGLLGALSGKGVVIAGGLHPQIATQYFRIGHMGLTATDESQLGYTKKTIESLEAALRENGFTPKQQHSYNRGGSISEASMVMRAKL